MKQSKIKNINIGIVSCGGIPMLKNNLYLVKVPNEFKKISSKELYIKVKR